MSTPYNYVPSVQLELRRAQTLHPNPHSAPHSASLILSYAIALHQKANHSNPKQPHEPENKLLTQIAALCLRRLTDSAPEPWTQTTETTSTDPQTEKTPTH